MELFFSKGRFLFATTRNFHLYLRDSPVILNSTNLGLVMEGQANQAASGCPLFLFLAGRNGFPHDDVVQITREHGQRLFSHLWTAGRVNFEFADLQEFPDFARNFPPATDDPDNWVLASLRHVRFDALTASQRPDPNGSPAYTRKGYELIQQLEAKRRGSALRHRHQWLGIAPADRQENQRAAERRAAHRLPLPGLDIIDYWSSTVLSLPAQQTNPGGGSSATPFGAGAPAA